MVSGQWGIWSQSSKRFLAQKQWSGRRRCAECIVWEILFWILILVFFLQFLIFNFWRIASWGEILRMENLVGVGSAQIALSQKTLLNSLPQICLILSNLLKLNTEILVSVGCVQIAFSQIFLKFYQILSLLHKFLLVWAVRKLHCPRNQPPAFNSWWHCLNFNTNCQGKNA